MVFVVFQRAANVGGHQVFKPSALAARLEQFGVVSIGAAGTFVARSARSASELRAGFRQALAFDPEMAIMPGRSIAELVREDPLGDAGPGERPFVSVLARRVRAHPDLPILAPSRTPTPVREKDRDGLAATAREGPARGGCYTRWSSISVPAPKGFTTWMPP